MAYDPQTLIGGALAPEHVDNLALAESNLGSLLGSTLQLEDDLATMLSNSLRAGVAGQNKIHFLHLLNFTKSRSVDGAAFQKSLARFLIPIVHDVTVTTQAKNVDFIKADDNLVPKIGHIVKDVQTTQNADLRTVVEGHKLLLSAFTPIQIINLCVNCPYEVMTYCCYQHQGKIWSIKGIYELLQIILKQKVILMNRNLIAKYKSENRMMFRNRANQARNQNRASITVMLPRVYMNMNFSEELNNMMNVTEVKNQVGRLGWISSADFNARNHKVNSIACVRNGANYNVVVYNHVSYDQDFNGINDANIINRQWFDNVSTVGRAGDGGDANAGDLCYDLIGVPPQNYGNTTHVANNACTFPAQNRAGTGTIQGTITLNGTVGGAGVTAAQLQVLFSTFKVKRVANEQINLPLN